MFSKILIANRGEIAIRIIRACKEMGIYSVAVFSEADKNSLHVSLADEAYCIGKAQVKDSYLNMHAIISAALASKAEAIHPGYGFLSENSEFASLCDKYGIAFIGPDAKTMASMSDKEKAIQIMKEAGLPIIPSSKVVSNIEQAVLEAEKIGYPLLIKARSGGGGKGIRLARNVEELKYGFHVATSEAASAFGDDGVYLEKFLTSVKHIEMQIIADSHGNVVCLGERDCSTQRKNQKVIEESPCVRLSDDIRMKMVQSSVKAVLVTGYKGVGTIEFLYDGKDYYFMEMNTRLQVEHPVTEMVTGIDLVKWQIRVASGMELGFKQEDIILHGHAIECRINA
ncbi:MAG TPA: biotin carboxylase N-terminal domain-containing protein, partial [Clostridia bacterium]|nr:biotin carboxylase N-terminal domain-containing protein [Clostridia bacterium]